MNSEKTCFAVLKTENCFQSKQPNRLSVSIVKRSVSFALPIVLSAYMPVALALFGFVPSESNN
jgi:hypothetical protein